MSRKGREVPHAKRTEIVICDCGDLVGINLLDGTGKAFAHAHFDPESALAFAAVITRGANKVLLSRAAAAGKPH